ncbi:MAG TPA: hypothetical protein VF191_06510 [Cyclobacteriaceae bacterium]
MTGRSVVLLLSFVSVSHCGAQTLGHDLTGSVWVKPTEFCTDSLRFDSNVKYREYYCEFQEDMVGEYEIKGDTLTLVEYNLSSQVPGSNSKLVPTYVWKYVLREPGALQLVYYGVLETGYIERGRLWTYKRIK